MKPIQTLIAIAALCVFPLLATAQQPAASPDSQKQGAGEWRKQREFIESLPEEVRNQFKAAREEAMKDPKIQALREEAEAASKKLRDAMREAMLTADPSLADVLDKIKPPKAEPAPAASTEMTP